METRYAKSGDVHIAYQVVGDGGPDLIYVHGFVSHLELLQEDPANAHQLRRLAQFARTVHFDRRGMGLSDRVSGTPTLEERMDDVRAVMDAVDSPEAVLLGVSEGGPLALLFAAAFPARTRALILRGSFARLAWAPDYTFGHEASVIESFASHCEEHWGTGEMGKFFEGSTGDEPARRTWWARFERNAASPGAIADLLRMAGDIDVRSVLSSIQAPTLILHNTDDLVAPIEHGRYLAAHIAGAQFVELSGGHSESDLVRVDVEYDAIEEFVTGVPRGPATTRSLGTVVFSDIVGSTREAARLSDATWIPLLERHNNVTRDEIARFGGHVISYTGDGFFALFDMPTPAIRCAQAMVRAVHALGLSIRVGIHTGECEKIGDDVGGMAVHIGSRVAALAGADEVLVSSTVRDLVVGSGIEFTGRGTHTLKGVPGEWSLFALNA